MHKNSIFITKTMLTQPYRCITNITRLFFSQSFSSSSIIPYAQNPSIIPRKFDNPSPVSHEIASSFSDWFKTSKNPNFDRIFDVLNSKNGEDLTKLDLGLNLSQTFVLDMIRYKSDDVLSCLKFFDWAGRQSNFRHSRATYVAIFKILSKANLNIMMQDLLDSFNRDKLFHKTRFNDILVIGYALAGKLDVALQLYGKMRFNGLDLDSVEYHVFLNALVDGGYFDAVKVLLGQLRALGHENKTTSTIVMKSMCKQGQFVEAEAYMRDLMVRGEVVTGYLLSILVDGLCKERRFLRAGKLLHEFEERGGVPLSPAYGVWIRELLNVGKFDEALRFFHEKKSLEQYIPSIYRYNSLISKLIRQNRLPEVCDLLMDMKESKIKPDNVTMNAVLCFFCKAGMMDVALELYKESAELGLTPNSLVFNYIINTLCGDGNVSEAYTTMKTSLCHGYFPGKKTFSILADSLCREGNLDKMKDLIMFSLDQKFMPPKSMYEKFIRALCRADRFEDGYMILGELNRLNETVSDTTYSYLITGFTKTGRADLTIRLLIEMQDKGHKPERRLFKSVIRHVCEMEDDKYFLQLLELQLSRSGHDVHIYNYFIYGAGHGGKPELGREVFKMMQKYGIFPNLASDVVMLQCLLKSDRIDDAMEFFVDISRRRSLGRKLYSSMVIGLCRAGKADFAVAILRDAKKNGQNVSMQCYEDLVKLYCSENNFDAAIRTINDLEKSGRKISSFIGNSLLFYSLHTGDVYRAWRRSRDVLKETPATSTLGRVIAAFSDQIMMDSKVEELEEIISKCFPIDLYTYNMLLRKLSMDHIDKACQLFNRMRQKGIEPNRWTYDILCHGLYKHGRFAAGQQCAAEMQRRGYFL
ncbi:pentatricopeptide repeat-containing protein At1g71210, mitochondrial [Silene latifolia]|uniref:pentatricopeptide repeat-containing protein At1g71210, mitochondrial n=1 Tax=Silene latifolia TaxID=37657 RepID=UPI003D76FDF8